MNEERLHFHNADASLRVI